jgi:N-acetylmuramoyl-L-alanine amidase
MAIGLGSALVLGALAWGVGELRGEAAASRWPESAAPLAVPATELSPDFGSRRIYLDAGHGAEENRGNRSSFCRDEQDFTLDLARDTQAHLEATGAFEVKISRRPGQIVAYADRVSEAEAWRADVFVSLHSDVRGETQPWEPAAGTVCLRSREAPGFAVLWSDHGELPLAARRLALARALSRRLLAIGLPAYDGAEYLELYAADDQAGVFVDRHRRDERIFVLWRPSMPSILIETHNALDDREAQRWEEPATRRSFAAALVAALVEALPKSD